MPPLRRELLGSWNDGPLVYGSEPGHSLGNLPALRFSLPRISPHPGPLAQPGPAGWARPSREQREPGGLLRTRARGLSGFLFQWLSGEYAMPLSTRIGTGATNETAAAQGHWGAQTH